MQPDFGKTADDYATHRQGFPSQFFEQLKTRGILKPGRRALDLGTGTGTVARGMALAGCDVTATDIAPDLLRQAEKLDKSAGVSVAYRTAPAEETGFDDAAFEVVTAGQCWHWFDRPRASAEVYRLLVDAGHVVVAHLDWIPLAGNVVAATEALILEYNPAWEPFSGGTGLHPAWLADLANAGFTDLQTFSFDIHLPYTHAAWRGRIRASAGIAASLSPTEVEAFDRVLSLRLQQDYPQDPIPVHHRVWAVIGRKP